MTTSSANLKKCQSLINCTIWSSKKHDVAENISAQETTNGGIDIPLITLKVLTAKIKDWLCVNEDYRALSITPIPPPNDIPALLKSCNVSLTTSPEEIRLSTHTTLISLSFRTPYREIYSYLLKSKYSTDGVLSRLTKPATALNCPVSSIQTFLRSLWSNHHLKPFERNLLYRLSFHTLQDKQTRWLRNLVDHPLCEFCMNEFETSNHIIFECPKLQEVRSLFGPSSWSDLLSSNNILKLRFTCSVLSGAFLNNSPNCMNFFYSMIN